MKKALDPTTRFSSGRKPETSCESVKDINTRMVENKDVSPDELASAAAHTRVCESCQDHLVALKDSGNG